MDKMYQITCTPECGFMVRSHDREEVKKIGKEHGKTAHKLELPDADVENLVKETMV